MTAEKKAPKLELVKDPPEGDNGKGGGGEGGGGDDGGGGGGDGPPEVPEFKPVFVSAVFTFVGKDGLEVHEVKAPAGSAFVSYNLEVKPHTKCVGFIQSPDGSKHTQHRYTGKGAVNFSARYEKVN